MKRILLCIALISILSSCAPKQEPIPTDIFAIDTLEPTLVSAQIATKLPTALATASATPEPTPTPIPKRYTAVLLGEDIYGTGTGARTDTFIILSYIPHWNDLLIISVPRDLYVEYGGQANILCPPSTPLFRHDRINRAYAFGSFDCVYAVVEHNFGLVVNSGIAVINFQSFVDVVDKMGGIEIVPEKSCTEWCGSLDGSEGYLATWREGQKYSMSGTTALCYIRGRMRCGCIDRDRRAQEMILAMKEQWLDEQPIDTLLTLLPFAYGKVRVDLPFDAIVDTIYLVKAIVTEDLNIRRVTFKYDQEIIPHTTEYGASVLVPLVDLKNWTTCLLDGHNSESCAWLHALDPEW